jgi:hypothetical protein
MELVPSQIQGARLMKKKKQKSLSSLKKKAWDLFSQWIRRRYASHSGKVVCVTCGAQEHWKVMHAGHFFPKSRGLVYYFHEKNVHVQCVVCNMFRAEQAKIDYTIFMQEKYGMGIVDELEQLAQHPVKYYHSDYESMIEDYKQRLELLDRRDKGLPALRVISNPGAVFDALDEGKV